ncbi:MAG: FAD-binding protein [Candidatus Abyssobacteria bacterium SURF_5]|uniref:FAD-binding protein n=1 Tax=Abyssobacteria bacterium (strain SURF_5) TaxID=2093360 RepID=A0A3A4NNR3_ABYX5|nr:MAG: FAD-binding protein [Candidatus Abyssubacteria bacterium SURF_5]
MECDRSYTTDLLIIGSEGAGGHAAIEARQRGVDVLIVTKGKISQCGASQMAGADFNVDGRSAKSLGFAGDERDSAERFFSDIVREGLYLNNQRMVEKYVEYCPKAMKDLLDWGMRVYLYESAHSEEVARGVISSGVLWVRAIRKRVKELGIPLLNDHMVIDLLTAGGRVNGAVALDLRSGETALVNCKAIILATGGWHRAYRITSGPYDLTGDGTAMAFRAGATLSSMELVQFIPLCVYWPPLAAGSICTYIFSQFPGVGEQVHLLNRSGLRFMEKYDANALEKSTKAIVSIASELEVEAGLGSPRGGVFFSLAHLGAEMIEMIIQGIKLQFLEQFNEKRHEFTHLLLDLLEQCKHGDIEVGNAAHYMLGGIKVDECARTSIGGLFAAGECSCGLWGAARVASACSQAGAQGKVAGETAAEYIKQVRLSPADREQIKSILDEVSRPLARKNGVNANEILTRMHQISGRHLWVIKEGAGLKKATAALELLEKDVQEAAVIATRSKALNYEWIRLLELRNMITCLKLSANTAFMREESRGEFYRRDFTVTNNDDWLRVLEVTGGGQGIRIEKVKPIVTSIAPPSGKFAFEQAVNVSTASLKR